MELIALWLDAMGNAIFLRANSRRERHQSPLPWDPDLEEASEAPPYILLIDNWFAIRRKRRRRRSTLSHAGLPSVPCGV